MAHIKIDYDGLMQQASVVGNISASYEDLNSRLKEMTKKINDGWQGEASREYGEMMQKYIVQATKMKGIIDEFRQYATKVTSDFQEVDRICAVSIRNSF